jgi:hypothetical protein
VELVPSLKEEIGLPSPQGFSQRWMWVVLAATIDTHPTQDHYILPHFESQTCHWNWVAIDYPSMLCNFCSQDVVEDEAQFMLGGSSIW